MSARRAVFITLALLLLMIGCRRRRVEPAEVTLVKIGDQNLTLQDFLIRADFELQLSGQSEPLVPEEQKRLKISVLRNMIERQVMMLEAKKLDLVVPMEVVSHTLKQILHSYDQAGVRDTILQDAVDLETWRQYQQETMTEQRLIQKAVIGEIEISDDDLRARYKSQQKQLILPKRVRVSQIVVESELKAREIFSQLKTGASFDDLVKAHSVGPERDQGGDMGYLTKGLPEFDPVFLLAMGDTSDVIQTEFGFHIFKVTDIQPTKKLSFEEVKNTLHDELVQEKELLHYHDWLKDVVSRTPIQYNRIALTELGVAISELIRRPVREPSEATVPSVGAEEVVVE